MVSAQFKLKCELGYKTAFNFFSRIFVYNSGVIKNVFLQASYRKQAYLLVQEGSHYSRLPAKSFLVVANREACFELQYDARGIL